MLTALSHVPLYRCIRLHTLEQVHTTGAPEETPARVNVPGNACPGQYPIPDRCPI